MSSIKSEFFYRTISKKRIIIRFLVFIFIIAIIFAIFSMVTVPYLSYRARAREAEESLKQIYLLQNKYRKQNGNNANTFNEIGWSPSEYNSYAFYLQNTDLIKIRNNYLPINIAYASSLQNENECLVLAVGNLDPDKDLDIWCITNSGVLKHLRSDYWRPWYKVLL